MSAEFIATMGDGGESYYTLEHDVTRQAAGDVESIRAKLADALEQRGYRVLNENPFQARRSTKGGAQSGCSQDILEYQTGLSIGLKSGGPNPRTQLEGINAPDTNELSPASASHSVVEATTYLPPHEIKRAS